MIRCIPIDGSAPFEVENDARGLTWEVDGVECMPMPGYVLADRPSVCSIEHDGATVMAHIESWRERAERLEKELAELRQKIAFDAMDKRREAEHG